MIFVAFSLEAVGRGKDCFSRHFILLVKTVTQLEDVCIPPPRYFILLIKTVTQFQDVCIPPPRPPPESADMSLLSITTVSRCGGLSFTTVSRCGGLSLLSITTVSRCGGLSITTVSRCGGLSITIVSRCGGLSLLSKDTVGTDKGRQWARLTSHV